MLSFWYQLVPLSLSPLKPVTLKSGMPGLLYCESPVNPGIPRAVPALVWFAVENGLTVAVSRKYRPTRKSFTRFGVSVWV